MGTQLHFLRSSRRELKIFWKHIPIHPKAILFLHPIFKFLHLFHLKTLVLNLSTLLLHLNTLLLHPNTLQLCLNTPPATLSDTPSPRMDDISPSTIHALIESKTHRIYSMDSAIYGRLCQLEQSILNNTSIDKLRYIFEYHEE